MGGTTIDEAEWKALHNELYGIRENGSKVKSFMVQHANKKYVVRQCKVSLLPWFHSYFCPTIPAWAYLNNFAVAGDCR